MNAPRWVAVTIYNGGGCGEEKMLIIGGCSVYYAVDQIDSKWVVQYAGLNDP